MSRINRTTIEGTIEFLGLWEKQCNPGFKPLEFERFRNEACSNYFALWPQPWIENTQAIGITSKSGRYGGTFAHRDITILASPKAFRCRWQLAGEARNHGQSYESVSVHLFSDINKEPFSLASYTRENWGLNRNTD